MVWWGSSSSSSSSNAVNSLDPDLREFLEKGNSAQKAAYASPHPRGAAEPSAPDAKSQSRSYWSQWAWPYSEEPPSSPPSPPQDEPQRPKAPPESLFPDGRYAHLWRTYQSPAADLSSSSPSSTSPSQAPSTTAPQQLSDKDVLSNLASSVRDAQAAVKKTAAENCIEEQIAMSECTRSGGWQARLTLCREENRSLNRCTEMQARFLKALGYQSLYMRVARGESVVFLQDRLQQKQGQGAVEVEPSWDLTRNLEPLERMQLHADKLYREMLERGRLMKEARERGEDWEEPAKPVMARERTQGIWPEGHKGQLEELIAPLEPKVKAAVAKRLNKLEGEERALEERVIEAELRDMKEQQKQWDTALKEEKKARLERKKMGAQTIGDMLKWIGNWSQEDGGD